MTTYLILRKETRVTSNLLLFAVNLIHAHCPSRARNPAGPGSPYTCGQDSARARVRGRGREGRAILGTPETDCLLQSPAHKPARPQAPGPRGALSPTLSPRVRSLGSSADLKTRSPCPFQAPEVGRQEAGLGLHMRRASAEAPFPKCYAAGAQH